MFSFVDQITAFEPGRSARGRFFIPDRLAEVPRWLLVEAVGQLAAWVAMVSSDFCSRPVAALVGEVKLGSQRIAGYAIDLAVEVTRVDERAIAYGGSASVADARVATLRRCLGPMLSMEQFDDPTAVRRRFDSLRAVDVVRPRVDLILPELTLVTVDVAPGESRRAELRVPQAAPFFDDHFPRRPVFPAALLIEALCRLATELGAVGGTSDLQLAAVRDIKVRAFTLPGQTLEMEATLRSARPEGVDVAVLALAEGKRVATANVFLAARSSG